MLPEAGFFLSRHRQTKSHTAENAQYVQTIKLHVDKIEGKERGLDANEMNNTWTYLGSSDELAAKRFNFAFQFDQRLLCLNNTKTAHERRLGSNDNRILNRERGPR